MHISVIIPTLNREKDLKVLLESIVHQIINPFEVIVVDQSDNDKTKALCQHYIEKFPLKYYYSSIKSLTYCKNFGIKKAKGEIIAFLDDDTELLKDYLEQIGNFFLKYPHAIGGMSKIINHAELKERLLGQGFIYKLYIIVASFFGINSLKKGFWILRSGRNIGYYESNRIIQTEWLSGCASWYKKDIFNKFRCEEKLIRPPSGEDRMLSYQIFKEHPGTLYYYPKAQLYHHESRINRLEDKDKIFLKVIYQFWFFYSCINKNYFFYWWGNIGEIVLHFLNACIGREPFINTWRYIKGNFKLIYNLNKVKNGDFNDLLDI